MKKYQRSRYHGRNGKSKSFAEALRHASRGVVWGFLFEANIRRQMGALVVAVVLGWWLQISLVQWGLLAAASVFVVTLELINSSIEALADAMHPDYSEHIQRSKDLSAGAVLGASCLALAVGLGIFIPAVVDLVG